MEALLDMAISSAPLMDVISDEGIDLLQAVWSAYHADPLFHDNLKQYQSFEKEDGLLFMITQDHHLLCIPKTNVKGQSICEIVISEAHLLLAVSTPQDIQNSCISQGQHLVERDGGRYHQLLQIMHNMQKEQTFESEILWFSESTQHSREALESHWD